MHERTDAECVMSSVTIKALWLQAHKALWSNCKQTQSSESRFFRCKKYELLLRWLRSLHSNIINYNPGQSYLGHSYRMPMPQLSVIFTCGEKMLLVLKFAVCPPHAMLFVGKVVLRSHLTLHRERWKQILLQGFGKKSALSHTFWPGL